MSTKERPILFSAPMVRAILEGRKTQTRRAFNDRTMKLMRAAASLGEVSWFMDEGYLASNDLPYIQQFSPYGQLGERLWVRETWAEVGTMDPGLLVYRADYPGCVPRGYENVPPADAITWKPSIHMFRRHSRILLEVTAVRIERLQDISEDDLSSEGIQEIIDAGVDHDGTPRDAYRALWESLNGLESWYANPWVWVIEFRRAAPKSLESLRAEVERPCCGTFHGSRHRVTCEKYRGKTKTAGAA